VIQCAVGVGGIDLASGEDEGPGGEVDPMVALHHEDLETPRAIAQEHDGRRGLDVARRIGHGSS